MERTTTKYESLLYIFIRLTYNTQNAVSYKECTSHKNKKGKKNENERKIISFLFHNCLRCFRNCILAKLTKKRKQRINENKEFKGYINIFNDN